MTLTEEYDSKLCSIEDILSDIRDGDVICGGGELCEPTTFYENFHKAALQCGGLELIKGIFIRS